MPWFSSTVGIMTPPRASRSRPRLPGRHLMGHPDVLVQPDVFVVPIAGTSSSNYAQLTCTSDVGNMVSVAFGLPSVFNLSRCEVFDEMNWSCTLRGPSDGRVLENPEMKDGQL